MTNRSKAKGDRYELEAVRYLDAHHGDLGVWNAQRMLGAGRKEDVGDILFFPDAAVQVKAYGEKALSAGLYQAAAGAQVQAANARHPFNLGMVLVPRARTVGQVRWAASVLDWPTGPVEAEAFTSSLAALAAVKKAGPGSGMVATVSRKGSPPILIADVHEWVAAYRVATGR